MTGASFVALTSGYGSAPFHYNLRPMRDPLAVEVLGDLIIVTRPGTSFSATYGKAKGEPNIVLLAAREGREAEREALSEFRADAFVAAMNKARELRWIV